jgi:hypothetical protein
MAKVKRTEQSGPEWQKVISVTPTPGIYLEMTLGLYLLNWWDKGLFF